MRLRQHIIWFLLPFLLLLAGGCKTTGTNKEAKPVVSVSILPQDYFIRQIAAELVEVNIMIPAGASPATYEPTVGQLSSLNRSELYLRIGHVGFELSWMEKIRSVNPDMKIRDISEGIEIIYGNSDHDHSPGHHHSGADPHVWMSVKNARMMAENTHSSLIEILPGQKALLDSNLEAFLQELDSLDRQISLLLENLEGRSFMIYHPALTYFARDYQLEQLSLENEGKEPSPSHMRRMTDQGRKHGISCIFLQQEFDQKNAEILAREIGATIVKINPLDLEWKEQMIFIASRLKNKL